MNERMNEQIIMKALVYLLTVKLRTWYYLVLFAETLTTN